MWDRRDNRRAPAPVVFLLVCALVLQGGWHALQPLPAARTEPLPAPLPVWVWRLASVGEPVAMAKLLTLWLQAHDHQAGGSIPYRRLDLDRLEGWLDTILTLDPRGQYPLQLVARHHAEVDDTARQRRMLAYIRLRFAEDPDRRWPWLAHAVLLARHRLQDLPLALAYAREIRQRTDPGQVPGWARQLEWTVLEAMGEREGARRWIEELLSRSEVTDPVEIRFLNERLRTLSP
ncbi:MAG: hypothetical protein H7837_06160 [Magnetococcus sp. MYC-9]